MEILLLFIIVAGPPLFCLALLVYLARWLVAFIRTIKRGKKNGALKETLSERKRYWRTGGIIFIITIATLIYLEFFSPSSLRYNTTYADLTEEEIIAERPDIAVSEADYELFNTILAHPALDEYLQTTLTGYHELMEYEPEVLPAELAEELTASYTTKPAGACTITLDHASTGAKEIDVSWQNDPKWKLFVSCLYDPYEEEPEDIMRINKVISCYRDGVRGEPDSYEDLEARYWNSWGSIHKEVPERDWFGWTDLYTGLLYALRHG